MEEHASDYDRGRGVLVRSARECPDPHARRYSILLLSREKDPDLLPLFVAGMKDEDKGVREQAARALAEMGEPATAALLDLIRDKEWRVRYRSAEALGLMGYSPGDAALIEALHDPKDHVRYMAAKSLGLIGDPLALEPLIGRLEDENEFVRRIAAVSLAKIGLPRARSAVAMAMEKEKNPEVREAMALALAGFTLSGPELDDENTD
ncbi:HEAT repeat protein [Methanolinea mesophila]|uniref:HEAT repeat domain-containing protein n=1 Tax=Methanolinea mesophila TaxID=547055 RepID=UPI001AE547EB|nr:HEAT repeat domain-containing protein [Methanolinea mesophila]MBP1929359.1 HEAT repeat protein [Methanolinea mesophila]